MVINNNTRSASPDPGILRAAGKKVAPVLASVLAREPWLNGIRWFELYLGLLQGKGAGDGWDIKAEVLTAVRFVKRANPVVFDVGANVGTWSRRFLEIRPDAQMYLFEPAPACRVAIEKLGLTSAKIVPVAVGRRKQNAILHTCHPTAEVASLYPKRNSVESTFRSIEVEVVCLDDLIAEFGIDRVDYLKMDIEGAELDALRGARKSLESGVIRALSFEFGNNNVDSRTYFRDFWDILDPLGFLLFRIAPGGTLVPIREYRHDLEYFKMVSNYVGVREEG